MPAAKTGTDLVQQQREMVAFVDDPKLRHELAEVLPASVTEAQFVRALKNAIITDPTGNLAKADRVSLYQAVLRCAMDGLLPDGRDAVILPFFDSKQKKYLAQYMSMIGGQRRICGEYGWALVAHVVYENDKFDPDYENHRANHKPTRLGQDPGELVGAYAIAEHRDGRRIGPKVMNIKQIERVRAVSRQPKGQLWTTWYDRACEKTVAKQVMKEIPWDSKDRERVMGFLERDENGDDPVTAIWGPEPAVGTPADDGVIEIEGEEIKDPEDAPTTATPGEEQKGGEPAEDASSGGVDADAEAGSPADFEGEEPPDDGPEEEPRFESSRYAGKTPSEVLAITEPDSKGNPKGVAYLQWALRSWKTPTMRAFLEQFAEQHPEIRS